jgi:transcriptional regulator with XRE-family HTH domain
VGRRLARRRRLVDKRQADVAAQLGWRRPQLSGWEHGKYQAMKLEQLVKLADILQTSVDYLLGRTADDPGVIPPWLCPGEALCLASVTLPLHTTTPLGGRR